MCIKLYGGSCDANVRVDKSSIKLDNTFIGMTSQRYNIYYSYHIHALIHIHRTAHSRTHTTHEKVQVVIIYHNTMHFTGLSQYTIVVMWWCVMSGRL